MKLLLYISDAIIPIFLFVILMHGVLNERKVYEDFLDGAKDGFQTVIGILPTLVGLMCAVGVLRASGFLADLSTLLGTIIPDEIFPSALLPAAIVKMFSSSTATGLVLDIFKEYGPDSTLGSAMPQLAESEVGSTASGQTNYQDCVGCSCQQTAAVNRSMETIDCGSGDTTG